MARSDNKRDFPELYGPSRRVRLVRLIVASVLLVILIVFLVWLLFFKGSPTAPSDNPSGVTEITNNGSAGGNNTAPGNTNDTSNGNSNTNGSTGFDGTQEQNGSNATSSKNGKLAETGPGDTVAVFIGSVIVASVGFKLFALKKARG